MARLHIPPCRRAGPSDMPDAPDVRPALGSSSGTVYALLMQSSRRV